MKLDQVLAHARARHSLPSPRARRLIRERAGLSQADLAAVLGVSEAAISRWEAGLRFPRRPALDAYAQVLARLAEELKGGER